MLLSDTGGENVGCDVRETPAQLGRKWAVFPLCRGALEGWKNRLGGGERLPEGPSALPLFLSPSLGRVFGQDRNLSRRLPPTSRLCRVLSGGMFGPCPQESRKGNRRYRLVPWAVIANHHKLGGLKQQKRILLQFWSPEV